MLGEPARDQRVDFVSVNRALRVAEKSRISRPFRVPDGLGHAVPDAVGRDAEHHEMPVGRRVDADR